ncbi:MAG: branched-chain amino acid transport system permease protein [Methylobacteriaceae bacterium]|nr:branched-chain amino acid transport system permease protein [Methylobacteriaceae bacterium]
MRRPSPRFVLAATLALLLAFAPLLANILGNDYPLIVLTRVLILAMAAVSLDLILGYGGMVSLGHAAFLGIGAYAVGIMTAEGVTSGFVQWPIAIFAAAIAALVIGVLSLRTRGVYFILVTLAFAQMVYFISVGLDVYGGDDGLVISTRSQLGLLNLANRTIFYFLCLALLIATIALVAHLARTRFGLVLRGAAMNERRMRALGFPVYRYRLAAFVIAGALCGLAGVLLANHSEFVSPSIMNWGRSADLIIMVVLGGMGSAIGPLLGAMVFMLAEETLSHLTTYWQLIFGPLILIFVRFARSGLIGLFPESAGDG